MCVSLAVFVEGSKQLWNIIFRLGVFTEIFNNKTDDARGINNGNDKIWRSPPLQKILLTNRFRKTKPRDATCAAVHKSTALAGSLSLFLQHRGCISTTGSASQQHHNASPRILFFARMQVARNQFLCASDASRCTRVLRNRVREINSPFSRGGKFLKAPFTLPYIPGVSLSLSFHFY